ncbi:hypothetical protein AAF712_016309 [Marasmius tenuissimus]|uniref:Uncharacterized protein n=1 Tax=Marasmius tenuissimus TaxID=585030 RepID=A0ABR2Z7U9_9AGAR
MCLSSIISGTFSYNNWGKKLAFDSKGRQKVKAAEFHKTMESLSKNKQDAIINSVRLYVKPRGRNMRGKDQDVDPEKLEDDTG